MTTKILVLAILAFLAAAGWYFERANSARVELAQSKADLAQCREDTNGLRELARKQNQAVTDLKRRAEEISAAAADRVRAALNRTPPKTDGPAGPQGLNAWLKEVLP